MDDRFVRKFEELSAQWSFTFPNRSASPPTWGQLKKLTQEAEKTLTNAGQPFNSTNLLLAMLAVITCQSSGAGDEGNN
ncbi:endogenous retrovirus group K member 21 Rec protein-like [Hyaena hyaena]|uniref:endogenous retrovirus group K member 21 Rec protein-like n=1 Tax=Hyaena hyaena TaxID=95912 RepID=UPI001920E313|nr:endogenous retrovirus group K member 21 Rec protein-like [Hyaena hyaena]